MNYRKIAEDTIADYERVIEIVKTEPHPLDKYSTILNAGMQRGLCAYFNKKYGYEVLIGAFNLPYCQYLIDTPEMINMWESCFIQSLQYRVDYLKNWLKNN